MAKIKVMDEILANKIAAGEVVERCSSVVKELVENSIDAGSTEIKIELIDAGTKEIKVTDNGSGMEHDDAINCFGRHATSKIRDEEDLFHIETLGFRGEALASIASVSQIELKTSLGEVGTVVIIDGGVIKEVNNGDARKGTIITVKNLFYNTPARLKHLKSLYTELSSISDYVNKIALSHSNIKFTLVNNNSILLNTDGSGNLLKTIKAVFGIEIAKKMIEVSSSNDDYDVEGYISLPEVHRANRNAMITLVNGRVVRNTELNRVINDAYHSLKPDTRYPVVVLNIEVDPSLIDVNIHPTKMDIKFSKLEELTSLITKMIKTSLSKRTLIPHLNVEEVKHEEKVNIYDSLKKDSSTVSTTKPKYEEIKIDFDMNVTEPSEEYLPVNDDLIDQKEIENEQIFADIVEEKKERLPLIYPVGIVHGTYIICQNDLGMYLIDQHAAKERINYEKYKKEMGNPSTNKIASMFPITIELPMNEFIIIKEQLDFLRSLQFDIEEFGMNSFVVKAHPVWLPTGYEEQSIRKIIEVVVSCERHFSIEKFNEKVATMLSCKMAIKANQFITMDEAEALINDLRNCDNPFNCPHGRPTVVFYSNYDMEKMFKRSGF